MLYGSPDRIFRGGETVAGLRSDSARNHPAQRHGMRRGVSRMGYVKLVASIILLAGMSTGSVLTDSQLTMVAILLAGFIAHGEE